MQLDLNNKTVLITAASKGIGKAIAEAYVKEGSRVIITSSSEKNLISVVNQISNIYNKEIDYIKCDLYSAEDIALVHRTIMEKYGNLDILVNNCGGPVAGHPEKLNDEDWGNGYVQVFESAKKLTELFLPSMLNKNWGRIVNVTSISAIQPVDNLIISNSFRAALTAYSKTMSNLYASNNITINCVAPGYTLTDRVKFLVEKRAADENISYDEVMRKMVYAIPMARMANPEEIADVVVFLTSSKASYITGATLHVDGGYIKGLF